jgi:hypothetical protein
MTDTDTGPPCLDWGVATETLRRLRHQKKLNPQSFLEDWVGGHCTFTMEPPELILAIMKLIVAFDEAGVQPLTWPSPPTDEQLTDLDEWVGECVAEARIEQDRAERQRDVQKAMNRVLVKAGLKPAPDGSKINPVHLQKSKFTLDELTERLKWTIAWHRAEYASRGVHFEFRREWLDPRSKRYIKVRDGGISNKQIIIMANLIEDRQEQRPFDRNWEIVTNWLRQQGGEDYSGM